MCHVPRLRKWLPNVLDALDLDARQMVALEEGDENARVLSAAPSPRVSMTIHEVLNRPVFCVHACDTVAHLKMMSGGGELPRRQSPIDAVLSFYGPFLGL